jgi:hypothetical protein
MTGINLCIEAAQSKGTGYNKKSQTEDFRVKLIFNAIL